MCGFIGVLPKNQNDIQKCFKAGLKAIQTRGRHIDTLLVNGAQYGYCRLPTDDVQNSTLNKITEHEGTITLFNGLITNTSHLIERYKLNPIAAQSDFLCLSDGLRHYGAKFLRHCRGMFACAFVSGDQVLLARDTIGIKPLYYIHSSQLFAFASEIKALTPFGEDIEELLPGQIIRYNKKSRRITKSHYSYEPYQNYPVNNLEECLTEAVVEPTKRYLANSTKNVALLLSGGLDSSIIAQLLVNFLPKEHRKRLTAFCIGNENAEDVQVAQELAKHLNLRLVCVPLDPPETSLRRLPDVVYAVESPYARVTKVALLYDALALEIKRRNIDVVVGGEGADELFFGYHRFIDDLTPAQSQEAFRQFYEGVFFNTLLQRYERIFARKQIEGRVPFLDQEVVALANRIEAEDKVQHHREGGHISKLPLRALGKSLGLPTFVFERPKQKMTAGATGKENSTNETGYLEQETQLITGVSFQQFVTTLYRSFFYGQNGDLLKRSNAHKTEEDIMDIVKTYQQQARSKV